MRNNSDIQTEIFKMEMLPFATTWMDLKGIWNKSDRERQIPQILYGLTYMWNLKENKDTNKNEHI